MITFKSTIILAVISVFIYSCGNSASNVSTTQATTIAEEEHHHNDGPIVLNDGEKWIVDEEMMVHIKNMNNDVNAFEANSPTDYAVLAKKIENNIELLTSNCTMTGQAHDELHKWLLPFIDLSEAFSASKSTQEFADNLQKIKTSFVTLNTYFK